MRAGIAGVACRVRSSRVVTQKEYGLAAVDTCPLSLDSLMTDVVEIGVLYTEHSDLRAGTALGSLWSYQAQPRRPTRRSIVRNGDGNHEYWLERTDPLLNTILPGTGVSVVVNFGERWVCGRSLATAAFLPDVSVIGPVTHPLVLRVGVHVQAIGAAFLASETEDVLGVRASELVDQIVPLADLWSQQEADTLVDSISDRSARYRVSALCRALVGRTQRPRAPRLEDSACRLITRRHGAVSIEEMAGRHGISRRQFARRFSRATGLRPKLYARITRFQALVHTLLSTDVSQWGAVASTVGFYDQAHMINEFRQFAGSPPTVFFQPHGDTVDVGAVQRRGRPSEWVSVTR